MAAVILSVVAGAMLGDFRAPEEPLRWTEMASSYLPNAWLVCPAGLCRSANELAVIYRVPPAVLREYWDDVVASQPRLDRVRVDNDGFGATYVARSAIFGFRDRVNVRFMASGGDHSTLAVHSRSEFGFYDFGVNRRRVEAWLAALSHLEWRFKPTPELERMRPEVPLSPQSADPRP